MDKYFIERVNSDNATLFCLITILTLQDYNLPSNDDDIFGEDLRKLEKSYLVDWLKLINY